MSYNPNAQAPSGFTPLGVYTVMVQAVLQKPSKAGNPMDQFDLEIVAPAKAVGKSPTSNDLVEVKTAGTKITIYSAYQNDSFTHARIEGLKKLGFVPNNDYESFPAFIEHVQEFTKGLNGMCFLIEVSSEPQYVVRSLTQEDVAAGKTQPERYVDTQGKPVIKGYRARADLSGIVGGLSTKEEVGANPY